MRNEQEYKGHTISPLSGTLQHRYGCRWYIQCVTDSGLYLDYSLCPKFSTLDDAASYIDMCREEN